METWQQIPDFPDYSVSDHGRVRRDSRARNGAKPGPLKNKSNGRYQYVTLAGPAGLRNRTLQQLVLLAFRGAPPSPRHQGAHWDGDTSNNRLGNLRWATPGENAEDRDRHGKTCRGEAHASVVVTEQIVISMRHMRANGRRIKDIADHFGVTRYIVSDAVHLRSWKHVVTTDCRYDVPSAPQGSG